MRVDARRRHRHRIRNRRIPPHHRPSPAGEWEEAARAANNHSADAGSFLI